MPRKTLPVVGAKQYFYEETVDKLDFSLSKRIHCSVQFLETQQVTTMQTLRRCIKPVFGVRTAATAIIRLRHNNYN